MEVLHMAKSELSTPMCERWAAARGDQAIITAFLDALEEKGVMLCQRLEDGEYARIYERDIEWLYMQYCDVDPKVLEDERRALVKQAQEAAAKETG
jgi:hypothetical protein